MRETVPRYVWPTSASAVRPRIRSTAEDAASPIAHAEYAIDAGTWQYIDPVGKLSDSKREHYDFQIPAKSLEGKSGEHLITVRVYDRHENVGLAKSVVTGSASK